MDSSTSVPLRRVGTDGGRLRLADNALTNANFSSLKGKEMRVMLQQPKFKSTTNIKGNLFVKNLPDDMDNKGLMDKFSTYGNILSCKVSYNKANGKPLHYGYVHFSDPAVAQKVLEDMNKDVVNEGEIYVMEYEKHTNDTSSEWVSCYVSNFPKTWTKEDLQKLFEPYGKIASVAVGVKFYNAEKVQGFVNFVAHDDAVKAVEELKDREIPVEGAEPMKLYVNKLQSRAERERANQAQLAQKKREEVERTKGRFLYVGFGSEIVTVETLKALFSTYGVVETCSIAKDKITKEPKPFGFICMDSVENAQNAVTALKNDSNNKLKVELAQTREERAKMLKEKRRNQMNTPYYNQMAGYPMNMARNPRKGGRMMTMQTNMMPMQSNMMPMQSNMMARGMMPMQPSMMPMQPSMMTMQPAMMTMQPAMMATEQKIMTLSQIMSSLPAITMEVAQSLSDDDRRNTFGERIFQLISAINDPRVSKITGMMLELPMEDLLMIVNNPQELYSKICEANEVLDQTSA